VTRVNLGLIPVKNNQINLMRTLPSWIPNFNAWMSAILLLLILRFIKFALREFLEYTGYKIMQLLSFNSNLALHLLIILSPIIVIAIAHNLLHIALDLFLPDIQTPEMSTRKHWFPGLMSWWEGLYGWLAITITMIVSTILLIMIFSPAYYLSEISLWWYGNLKLFSPLILIQLVNIAYLYQFEQLVRQHLISVGRHES
jgi:hypothetical protein